jgi:RNA polymerase sigma-70 factor (ECF subfamily)
VVARTDGDLWRHAGDGEAAAFGELFERHAKAVYNHLFRRTGDWSLAEELTSVVFLEAWRRRTAVRIENESVLPWLLGVATNVLRNSWRSRRRHRAALERFPRETPMGFSDDADARLDDEKHMRAMLHRLRGLPRREADVLALCVWAELTYEEAAVALEIPIGTVRSRLSRAKARLREPERSVGHERDGDHAVPVEEA